MWTEYPRGGNFCLEGECFTRVHAAVATPDAPFGPSSLISGLGNVSPAGPVGAIGDGGRRLVSWANGSRDIAHNPLMVTLGSPQAPVRDTPRKPLRVAVTVSRRALRAAARGARLRARVTCNEACAIRAMIYSNDPDADDVLTLPAAVLARRGTVTTRWRLLGDERHDLRQTLHKGRLSLPTVAEDRPGHLVYLRARVRS